MDNKTITITKEEFTGAIAKAVGIFENRIKKVAGECPAALTLQNMIFGAEVTKVLFGENEDESKGEE